MVGNKRGKRLAKYEPSYVVFDLETTGINSNTDRIVEVAGIKVVGGKVEDTFSTLVNPERSIPKRATMVNGITDEMVAGAPKINHALDEFLSFSENHILVGHNIHTFDMKFIYNATEELYGGVIDNDYIDTLYLSRKVLPQLRHHKLVDLSAYFHISSEGAHRALNDCWMNQKCYEELGKLQSNITVEICPKCGGELMKRNGKFGEFFGCGNYPECRYTRNI
ncbi:DNA polymerase-3 subunit epsilon [Aequitasia blattaphilus]|uniref:Exonuclease domain-containing protein n=1 Tax=Aequitasia blattaphilus TaxID=2949332 RepID=A0ABT1EDM2_9FIRM|nr:exonuclease domain-containing protein [Aequitasia blattaphilus]MCP1103749.1 exonuclease domain-containing protein [Aequitasia blattaphilus]MCR8616389.1 exonuclease domain-containing protein [Aequitasia blattaphilus]